MKLTIDHHQKIAQVQNDFQRHFPFLKIEFYTRSHDSEEGTSSVYQLRHDLTIGEAQDKEMDGVFHISPDMKVSELEKAFEDIFGLHVQVFRQSGKIWLQTISTDHKTLAEQNKMAMEMNRPVDDKTEPIDIHEQE